MNAISTISAKALGPILLDYLPRSNFAEEALQTTGLPVEALGDPDAQLPQLGVWKLANRLALLERNLWMANYQFGSIISRLVDGAGT